MGTTYPTINTHPAAARPLKIAVTDAGQLAALKALVRGSLPLLRNPEGYPQEHRHACVDRLERAVTPSPNSAFNELDAADGKENDTSGSWLEEDL